MRKTIFLLWSFVIVMTTSAIEMPNGEPTQNNVSLGQIKSPRPHFANVATPVAMYNSMSDVLTVTLDATYYGEYTICIETTLSTYDYYPTSATTVIPLVYVDPYMTIYIDSDDCGSWYGLTAASKWRKAQGSPHSRASIENKVCRYRAGHGSGWRTGLFLPSQWFITPLRGTLFQKKDLLCFL